MRSIKLLALAGIVMLGLNQIASADAILNSNNNNSSTATIGTVSVTTDTRTAFAGDTLVTLTMASGFSLKTQDGSDFNFQSSFAGLTASQILDVTGIVSPGETNPGTYSNLTFTLNTGQNISGFGTFTYTIHGIGANGAQSGTNVLGNITSVDALQFDLSGVSPSQVGTPGNTDNATFAIHYCSTSDSNCSSPTGFAANSGATPTPEPGSMLLLGTGLSGAAFLIRRRR